MIVARREVSAYLLVVEIAYIIPQSSTVVPPLQSPQQSPKPGFLSRATRTKIPRRPFSRGKLFTRLSTSNTPTKTPTNSVRKRMFPNLLPSNMKMRLHWRIGSLDVFLGLAEVKSTLRRIFISRGGTAELELNGNLSFQNKGPAVRRMFTEMEEVLSICISL